MSGQLHAPEYLTNRSLVSEPPHFQLNGARLAALLNSSALTASILGASQSRELLSPQVVEVVTALVAAGIVERSTTEAFVTAAAVVDEMERRDRSKRMASMRAVRNREKMAALAASAGVGV